MEPHHDMKSDIEDLRRDIDRGVADLQRLRDEVIVRLHLASMEVKDEWARLEPQLFDIQRRAKETTRATRDALRDATSRLQKLAASI